ncbi:hypothetical protein CNR22_00365 [Sphingobacteriaceae bacterium]|nr:hypothetical protein CNR22_00365 [Sphingobacteriaceae bacterium]
MSQHKSNFNLSQEVNLLENENYKNYLSIISEYGVAQSGGSFPISLALQARRLVFDVNLLVSPERKHVVYSEIISKN